MKANEVGSSVTVDEEKIAFTTIQDAQFLGCLIEAANFCYFGRRANHVSLDELKAFVLITAVKNQREDAVARLLQRTSIKEDTLASESEGGAILLHLCWPRSKLHIS